VDRPRDLEQLLMDLDDRPADAPNTRRVADRLGLETFV
jgi:hypothetical protein